MRWWIAIAFVGCSKAEPPPSPAPAPGSGADPLGPCVKVDGARCLEHDPRFTAATRAARTIDGRVDSGKLVATAAFSARWPHPAGRSLEIRVDALGAPARFSIDRWEPAADGWRIASDAFTPAEPGGHVEIVAAPQAELLIAVTADPPADFRVVLSPR